MSSKEDAIDLCGTGTSRRRRGSAPKAGSVWESRMKLDEVKGGVKVLIATHDSINPQQTNTTNPSPDNPQMDKTVQPKQSPNTGKRKTWKSESFSEGSPVQIGRQRSELSKSFDANCKELSVFSDGIKKSPVSINKTRSVNERNSVQLRKLKSDPTDHSKSKILDSIKNSDGPNKDLRGSFGKTIKSPVENKSRSDEDCKELVVCEEKAIISNVDKIKNSDDDDFIDGEEDGEIEVEKKSFDIKEINVQQKNPKKIEVDQKKLLHNNDRPTPISSIVKKQAPPAVNHAKIHPSPIETKPISDHGFHGIPRTNSKLQNFVDLVMWRDVSKSAFVFGIGTFVIISSSYTKDLNISFISVISYLGLVYLAAIFLFRSLITRGSIDMEDRNQDYVVGEEEAIWLIKLVLPYVNEFLLKLRALFSGDPSTTMKLAVLLFILARCGSSITIWKMAKLGFIGVFTVPKVCSSYSSQLTAYGTFWIRRFRDAWESCSHKKAVGFAIFTLVWNLSSVVARIWAVFMLFVGFKYYQHSLIRDECAEVEAKIENSSWQAGQNVGGPRIGRRSSLPEIRKQKKVC